MVGQTKRQVKHVADIVGEFGKWQLRMCCFCFVLYAMEAINNLGYTFHAFHNEHWCADVPLDYKVCLDVRPFGSIFGLTEQDYCHEMSQIQ